MPTVAIRKERNTNNVALVKKIRDYSEEPVFKKKAERAIAFLKKNGTPPKTPKKK